jgi:hypothetical protein
VNFASEMLGDVNAPGVAAMIERIVRGRTSITPSDLLDECLYELGCAELKGTTRQILLDTLGAEPNIDCGSAGKRPEFDEVCAQMLRLIAASREYQLA